MRGIHDSGSDKIIVLGDFNFPSISWEECTTNTAWDSKESRFIEAVRDSFLTQHVTTATRCRGGDCPSLLDLVFSNLDFIHSIDVKAALGKSDHAVIELRLMISSDTEDERSYLNYDKGNYSDMRNALDIDWQDLLTGKDVHQQWDLFTEMYNEAVDKYIPTVTVKNRKIVKTPIELSMRKKLKNLINRKDKLWKKFVSTREGSALSEYRRVRNQVRRFTRKAEKNYEKKYCLQSKGQPQKVLEICQKKNQVHSHYP